MQGLCAYILLHLCSCMRVSIHGVTEPLHGCMEKLCGSSVAISSNNRSVLTSNPSSQVMRNLGIISSFQVGQKLDMLQASDYVWQEGLEPEHSSELALYKFKYLKLDLRYVPKA